MGTPEYMAPEQAYSADAVDARADIFSLGVMIFEMLAGRRPVGGDELHQIAAPYISGQVAQLTDLAPNVPAQLAAAIHVAMAPLAKDRFATVADLRSAIEPFMVTAKPTPARASATPAPTPAVAAAVAQSAGALVAVAATNPPGKEGYPAVPRTLPPDEEPAPGAASSDAMARGTPLGGFDAQAGAPGAFLGTVAGGPFPNGGVPATSAPALANGAPATAFDALRPGGTAIGSVPMAFDAGNPYAAGSPGGGGTALDPSFPAPRPRRKRSGFASFLFIMGLATAIAGVVVGGVYIAQEYGKREDHADDPPRLPPPPPVTPPTPTASATEPVPPVVPPPPTTPTAKPPSPPHPGPVPPTSPSTHPSTRPPIEVPPFPFVLPSALPNLPFQVPNFQPPGAQPQPPPPPQPQPPPQPDPPPHRPPIIPRRTTPG